MERGRIWRHFDFWLLGAVVLLVIFGIAMIRSAMLSSPDTGVEEFSRQLLFALIGIPVLLAASAIDYRLWGGLSGSLYVFLLLLLVFVIVFGNAVFGANRWIPLDRLGIPIPINIQPSELGKFIMVIALGNYLASHAEQVRRFGFIVRTLIYVGVPVVLIAMQPDFSSCILYGVVWFAVLWASGLRWQHVLALAGLAGVIGLFSFFVALQFKESQYIARRIVFFLWPDPTSKDYRDATYNIQQALISIGSGGLFGQGYGNGSQVQLGFLKVRHTDFIFAAIANEFGLIGSSVVIGLFILLVVRIFRAAQTARDSFGRLICFGVGTVIMFEAFTNIASNLNLMPVTGSPLPFVSYGGSSLWTFLFAIGLVESVVLRHKQIEF